PGDIWMVWRVGGSAKYAMLVTFAATMLLPLENSIYIGVGLSLLLYVYTSAGNLTVVQLQPNGDGHYRRTPLPEALPHDDALVISVNGNLYFAAVRRLREVLPDPATANNTVVILRIRDNQYFGTTGIRALGRYAEQLRDHNSRFVLSGVNPHIRGQLNRAGGVAVFGEENIFEAGDVVFASTERAMVSARQWLQRDVIAVE
ncbi:MAG: STAS domain-containing protein, partial [Chloroflexota bacterium]